MASGAFMGKHNLKCQVNQATFHVNLAESVTNAKQKGATRVFITFHRLYFMFITVNVLKVTIIKSY